MTNFSVNSNSVAVVKSMIEQRDSLSIKVQKLPCGTTVLDTGVKCSGSIIAGLNTARAALGGLAEVVLTQSDYEDLNLPTVNVTADNPAVSLFGCQYPVPTIDTGGYYAIWSGPGKVHIRQPKQVFKLLRYKEPEKLAVFLLQSDQLPTDAVAKRVAQMCGVKPRDTYLIVVPTGSLAGAVQVAARMLEDPFGRAVKVCHYDIRKILAMSGSAPLSPVYPDIWKKPGLTPDDMLFYATRITFFIKPAPGDDLHSLAVNLNSEVLPAFGKSFYEMLKDVNFTFEKLDSHSYASASITIYDLSNGALYRAGRLHLDLIRKAAAQAKRRKN